ncbi:sugar ABC transporter substrate-binding protein [Saccharopolyspora elongata]|uniref:Sugar ABC transporter substrate-binding protein n=1 Tax=Saccharopolyspora elongata TaxID=2530387 RepID=A0A4R4Y1M3_9PSEU|nr:substrate-binding domain-containing protein [Saccharopolyspora elongata]TDD38238.1 sugar ABC transporter substrate-binding protein [Saccharopolyspora elongata]
MGRTPAALIAMACSIGLLLVACGNNRLPEPDADAAAPGTGGPRVGVILPDTATSARWAHFDQPMLQAALRREGLTPIVQNAQGDAQKFAQIADGMLSQRVQVLIIAAPSGDAGATVEQKAERLGVPVIDYDRLNVGGSADYYVSFDHEEVGELQARALATAMRDKPGGQVIEIGGATTDHNATLVHHGQSAELGPRYAAGELRLASSRFVDGWDNQAGGRVFEQLLTANDGRVDGVLAANDGLASAVITVLQKYGLAGAVPVTGQDMTVDGLRAILQGYQSSTVFKPIRDEASVTAELAAALARGDTAAADALAHQRTPDPVGGREVKSVLLPPQLITRDNIKSVLGPAGVRAEEICGGELAGTCHRLGIA